MARRDWWIKERALCALGGCCASLMPCRPHIVLACITCWSSLEPARRLQDTHRRTTAHGNLREASDDVFDLRGAGHGSLALQSQRIHDDLRRANFRVAAVLVAGIGIFACALFSLSSRLLCCFPGSHQRPTPRTACAPTRVTSSPSHQPPERHPPR